ncbi:MAG TPA: hypothetical protein DEO70_05100 [Bacteroidales bacterium]|nr:MAG: hypothetical protein A2X11_02025 [Bacteroidetes bacterium GWE2_42_24]OFY28707.1 MAG: hypothetical protein A2X09_12120 [Bacteroidetes bacterium GWF2_43_11]PKP25387.1 MAG: hypothetical protein CVU06_04175 [Bacteroidetes bacterium HGW-Bacteroidetes-22]HBZ66195.1 hypothetical protein [Bacteroidales bacterium]
MLFVLSCSKTEKLNTIVSDDATGDSIFLGYGTVDVLKHDIFRKYYVDGLNDYHPADSLIDSLRPALKAVTFKVIMGTWDTRSRKVVPQLFNVLFSVGSYDPSSQSNVELIGVNRAMKAGNIDLDDYKVKRLPLIIVYRSGEEAGRLQGKLSEPMEKVLFDILTKKK